MKIALYRKYRPQTFAQVVGRETVVQIIQNSLKAGRVSHAYLFVGQRGTGKTTIARILAKAVNCLDSGDPAEPCNQCAHCLEINRSQFVDLVEIDAASNRGIDEIRDLKEGIRFSPIKANYKVFIIDEVHMLTKEAFNALLKTLEEPPEHSIFILATTEPEKLPATIISRSQRFDFHHLTVLEIAGRLKEIAKAEGAEIADEAAREIAVSAEGSMRDGESVLDQLLSLGYGKIDLDILEKTLGRVDFEKTAQLFSYLALKQTKEALELINKIQESGADVLEFSKKCLKTARKILLLKISPEMEKIFSDEFTREQMEKLKKLSQEFSNLELKTLLDELIKVGEAIKHSPLPILPLEMVVLKMGEIEKKI